MLPVHIPSIPHGLLVAVGSFWSPFLTSHCQCQKWWGLCSSYHSHSAPFTFFSLLLWTKPWRIWDLAMTLCERGFRRVFGEIRSNVIVNKLPPWATGLLLAILFEDQQQNCWFSNKLYPHGATWLLMFKQRTSNQVTSCWRWSIFGGNGEILGCNIGFFFHIRVRSLSEAGSLFVAHQHIAVYFQTWIILSLEPLPPLLQRTSDFLGDAKLCGYLLLLSGDCAYYVTIFLNFFQIFNGVKCQLTNWWSIFKCKYSTRLFSSWKRRQGGR